MENMNMLKQDQEALKIIENYIVEFIDLYGNLPCFLANNYITINYMIMACFMVQEIVESNDDSRKIKDLFKFINQFSLKKQEKRFISAKVKIILRRIRISKLTTINQQKYNMISVINKNFLNEIKIKEEKNIPSNYLSESLFINLEKFYDNNKFFPTLNDIEKYMRKIANNKKDLYVIMPNIVDYDFEISEYSKIIFLYESYYKKIINIIMNFNKPTYFIISKYLNLADFEYYAANIKILSEKGNLKFGIIIRNFDQFYEIDDMWKHKLILINYDEITNRENNFLKFKEKFEKLYRSIHDFSREKKVRTIVNGKNLTNEKILKKLNIMGFKEMVKNI